MQRISITNPQNIIDGTAKKYYFKLRNTGGPKGDKGDKGDTGATGPQGPQGNAATVSVGSTTTLPVGYDATVTNTGSIYNAVLDFGIPQGPQGPQGAKGDKGDTGAKGDTGPRGPQGEKGTNATVYVGTTTTTNPGTQARVYNSGTDSNAVLNFEIPRGDVGPQPELEQATGTSTTKAMSQKATTDALNTKQATISSSNKLSADLVTDTSTTNKFVTAEDKTTWNAKQNALTAGQGIDITSDIISTPALVPEVVASLPAEGAEGKLYLTPKAHTTSTATGNPIEATVTEQAGQLESFQLDGDTFQQSYTGKNLLNPLTFVKGRLDNGVVGYQDGTSTLEATATDITFTTIADFRGITSDYVPVVGGSQYIQNQQLSVGNNTGGAIAQYDSSKTFIRQDNISTGTTVTMQATTAYIRIYYFARNAGTITLHEPQLEAGSQATSFEPYVGGQASPNPDYPQAIQTVTGEQTVTINSTAYPISLGSIELCKLGTYQDYIYKDGDSWKVHKANGKTVITDKNTRGSFLSSTNTSRLAFGLITPQGTPQETNAELCGKLERKLNWSADSQGFFMNGSTIVARITHGIVGNTEESFVSWLKNNPLTVYYALATATDTTITDQTLIAQLEAIRTASLQNGTNTITNSTPAPNLAGDMEIGYYGYNPTNRYDKFIWLDLNNAYEQLNTTGTSSTLSTRTLGTTTEQPTVTRSLETETITLKKGEAEPIEDKTELPTILDEETEEAETSEPEESDGTDER